MNMNILVTNDDGIYSRGISLLVEAAREFGDVYVVAPSSQQSAVSQGLTIHEPLQIERLEHLYEGLTSYSISGKPADCIKVALEYLHFPIDLVFSGVNDGPNLGTDILYSGTVAAASEASIFNIPSVAFSTDFGCFSIVEEELVSTIDYILRLQMPTPGRIVNVNFPLNKYSKSKGFRLTTQGMRIFSAKYRHDEGKYWQEGNWVDVQNEKNTDVTAVTEGYISITPLGTDRTDHELLRAWKEDHHDL
jgi:5'-nucleotidase